MAVFNLQLAKFAVGLHGANKLAAIIGTGLQSYVRDHWIPRRSRHREDQVVQPIDDCRRYTTLGAMNVTRIIACVGRVHNQED